ncbi:MAG: YbjN domain-containing protein [Deinococcaceae bacterium]
MDIQEAQSLESIFIQIGSILTKMEWPYSISTRRTTYSIDHTFFGEDMPLYISVLGPLSIVAAISTYPCICPPDRIPGCMELISLINWGLPYGNFEIHIASGAVRFKNTIDFSDTSIDDQLIETLLESAHYNINYYAYLIYDYIFNNKSPQESLKSTKAGVHPIKYGLEKVKNSVAYKSLRSVCH